MTQFNKFLVLVFLILFCSPTPVESGPFAAALCIAGCNVMFGGCAACGVGAATVTFGAAAPAAGVACTVAYTTCMGACTASTFLPTP